MELKISQKIEKSNICFSYFGTDFFKLWWQEEQGIAILIYNSSIITDFNTERANLLKKVKQMRKTLRYLTTY